MIRHKLVRVVFVAALAGWGVTLVASAASAQDKIEPSRVTIAVKYEALADVLKLFADQSGNSLLAVPGGWRLRPIDLDVKDLPYFEALDRLCRAAALRYEPKDRVTDPVLTLVGEAEAADAGVCLGAAAVKKVPADHLKAAAESAGLGSWREPGNPDTVFSWAILNTFWEDRLPVVSDTCEITKAFAEDGRALEVSRFGRGCHIGPWTKGKPRPSARRVFAMFRNLPEGIGKTVRIEGTLRLDLGVGVKALSVPGILAARGMSVAEGDLSLEVTFVNAERLGPDPAKLLPGRKAPRQLMLMTLQFKKDGKDPVAIGVPDSPYGIFLADAKGGRRYPPSRSAETRGERAAPGWPGSSSCSPCPTPSTTHGRWSTSIPRGGNRGSGRSRWSASRSSTSSPLRGRRRGGPW